MYSTPLVAGLAPYGPAVQALLPTRRWLGATGVHRHPLKGWYDRVRMGI